ncbi:MAG: hypothetical protein HZA90_10280 [Verrucomicrobia bacterium]|nr:hypothetical protein [Verrucomicrobiota bacterium]
MKTASRATDSNREPVDRRKTTSRVQRVRKPATRQNGKSALLSRRLPRTRFAAALLLAIFVGCVNERALAQSNPTNGLLAYWSFDNGTATNPISADYQGTLLGNFSVVDGYSGKALWFNGTNTSISFGAKPYLPKMTLAMFVLVDTHFVTAPYPAALADKWGNGENFRILAGNAGGSFRFNSSFHAAPFPHNGTVYPEQGVDATNTVATGQFHHVAITYDGDYLRLYVDGKLNNQSPTVKSPYTASIPAGIPFTIGSLTGGSWPFNGIIDEVFLFERALSDAEIGLLVAPAILITSQPRDAYALPGGTARFNTAASLSGFGLVPGPLSYQWLLNGSPIAGATNSALAITSVQSTSAGFYSVIVRNPTGTSVTSSNATLTIVTPGVDDDHDGLLNETEVLLGTDPLSPDTDGDNLSDYDALFVHGTNPLLADTDADGIPDDWEVANRLNPRINDANDDLDLDGLTNLQEYQNRSLGYRPNQADSLSDGRSDYERLFGGQTNRFCYDRNDRLIGADYNRGSNGFAIAYVYDGNGNLLRQKSLVRDANHNGLPDVWEFLHGLTNNASAYADSDGDGWTDLQEWKAGTNPANSTSQPGLLGNPGLNIASLALPFTPSNFVVGVGQLDGQGAEEIVIGADGNPGTNTNFLLVLAQTGAGWQTQRVDVGPFGVTSIAVGQLTNRPAPAIYVGLRGTTNGSGRIMEFRQSSGTWDSSVVALSTNMAAFVLGIRPDPGLLASLATTNAADDALYAASFSGDWSLVFLDTNSSHRGLGTLLQPQSQTGSAAALRLLDSGGIAVRTTQFSALISELVSYWPLDGNSKDAAGSNNGTDTAITYSNADGRIHQGARLNGSTSVIRTATRLSFSDFTFAAWVKTTANNVEIVADDSGPGQYAASMRVASHTVMFGVGLTGTGWMGNVVGSTPVAYGNWHLVVGTRHGSTYTIYVDGKQDGQATGSPMPTTSIPIAIGAEIYGGALWEVMNGDIDEVGIWSRALSAEEVNLLYGNGFGVAYDSAVLLPEPSAIRTNNWQGCSLASGLLRGTNGSSIFYTFADDKNTNGLIDFADDFVTTEYLVSGTNAGLLTLSRQPIVSSMPAQSYGLASVNFLNSSNDVFFTGEPDGQVFAWTAAGATNPLQRQLFSAHHMGKGWHAMAGVNTLEPGEGLVGLRVDPAAPDTCDLILWPPQSQLPQLSSPPQTAPSASVLPQSGVAGTLVPVGIRLWDAEGNASTPFLEYQLPGATNWQDATIASLDGTSYSSASEVTALPTGSDHVLVWNASTVFTNAGPTNLWFRVRAQDMTLLGDWSAPMPYTATVTPDTDGDGLPDAWEQAKLHALTYGAGDDPDLDGFTNSQEYLADTDPLDGTAYLRITGVSLLPGGVKLDWRGGVQSTQYLQRTFAVGGTNSWLNIHIVSPPTPVSGSYTDWFETNALHFYRIKATRP